MTAVESSDGIGDALVIETMQAGHVSEVAALEEFIFDSPWTVGMFRQEVSDRYLSRPWVATMGGRLIGYLISWFLREEVHLLNIAVDPAYQGRGFGRQMLQHLIDEAVHNGRDVITLEVRESNAPARHMYESFGFAVVGRRAGYYQDNREDAVVMTLDLRRDGGQGDS